MHSNLNSLARGLALVLAVAAFLTLRVMQPLKKAAGIGDETEGEERATS